MHAEGTLMRSDSEIDPSIVVVRKFVQASTGKLLTSVNSEAAMTSGMMVANVSRSVSRYLFLPTTVASGMSLSSMTSRTLDEELI